MFYPITIEQKLGFDRIRVLLSDLCFSTLGRNFVAKMRFSENFDQVVKMVEQTAEMKNVLAFDNPFPSQNYFDVTAHLNRLAVEGAFLVEEEYFELMLSIKTIQNCIIYFQKNDASLFSVVCLNGRRLLFPPTKEQQQSPLPIGKLKIENNLPEPAKL